MTTTQIELVQNSWKKVATSNAQTAGLLLYTHLLEIVPEIRIMLRHSPVKEPSRKVLSVISYLIRKLHTPEVLMNEVGNLTRRHIQQQLRDEQYIRAGRALLYALEAGMGDNWNRDIKYAWVTCYTTLAEAMMKAAGAAEEEPLAVC